MAKAKVGICAECGKEKKFKGKGLCTACFNKKYNTKKCVSCGEVKIIIGRGMCSKCYNRVLAAEKKAGAWTTFTDKNKKQNAKKSNKKTSSLKVGYCIGCGEKKNLYRNEMCTACNKLFYRPVAICEKCGELKKILAKKRCQQCYEQPSVKKE